MLLDLYVFCVVLCRLYFFCHYSFGHCDVHPSSSIYVFWLPLWYLQTLSLLSGQIYNTLRCIRIPTILYPSRNIIPNSRQSGIITGGATEIHSVMYIPLATLIIWWTMSIPVIHSVIGCSTCNLVFISRKKKFFFESTRNSTVPVIQYRF